MGSGGQIAEAFDRFLEADLRRTTARCHIAEANRLERAAKPECGTCYHWMKKSSCPREARGEKPSCADPQCEKYMPDGFVDDLRQKAGGERVKALALLAPSTPASAGEQEGGDVG